jgi:hypothetical protein
MIQGCFALPAAAQNALESTFILIFPKFEENIPIVGYYRLQTDTKWQNKI